MTAASAVVIRLVGERGHSRVAVKKLFGLCSDGAGAVPAGDIESLESIPSRGNTHPRVRSDETGAETEHYRKGLTSGIPALRRGYGYRMEVARLAALGVWTSSGSVERLIEGLPPY